MASSQAITISAPAADLLNITVKASDEGLFFCTGTSTRNTSFLSSYLKAPQVSRSLLKMMVHCVSVGMAYSV